MYYAYKKIKKHRENKRLQAERQCVREPGSIATSETATSDGAPPDDDEEAAGDPLYTGKPLDPANRKSKNNSWVRAHSPTLSPTLSPTVH
jgi:hypothetical protein